MFVGPTRERGGTSTATAQQFSIGGLINVPDHLRKSDEQAFSPRLISIGPIHHSNVKLQTMKKCKEEFCTCFIRRTNKTIEAFKTTIRGKEEEIRSYYAQTIVSSIRSDDFVTMILLDGMFILEYFLREVEYNDEAIPRIADLIAEWMPPILKFDLVLFENQLPFFVLKMLFDEANLSTASIMQLAMKFFECYDFQKMDREYISTAKIEHFTDLVRLFYLKINLPSRTSGGAKLAYSATQLHEAGVKLKGVAFDEMSGWFFDNRRLFTICNRLPRSFPEIKVLLHLAVAWLRGDDQRLRELRGDDERLRELRESMESRELRGDQMGRRFLDIRFNNGVLEIPCIKLNYERVCLIRNIIALEQSLYVGHAYVTDFFVILDFLIDNSKDVDLLCDKGILVNYLGDSNATAFAVNSLNIDILWDYMNSDYSAICSNLNAFYKKRWHRWWATLWRQYFSTPWRFASTSAAIILLVLTAIQTICSLKSTKW